MTEESTQEQTAPETQEAEAPQEAQETPETKESQDTDYKALFEKEQGLRKKAEGKVQYLKGQNKQTQEVEYTQDDTRGSVDSDELAELVRNSIAQEVGTLRKEMFGDRIAKAISERAVNPDHAELVKYHYDNTLNLTGNMEDDIDNAFALAEKNAIRQKLAQTQRAQMAKKTKDTASQDATAPQGKGAPNTAGLTEGLKRLIANGTFVHNPQTRRFESKSAKIWFKTDKAGNKVEEGRL